MNLYDLEVDCASRGPEALDREIKALLEGPSGWAIAGWIAANLRNAQDQACAQGLASDHGRLAHAAGGVARMRQLQSQLAQVLRGPQSRVRMEPGPESSEIEPQ